MPNKLSQFWQELKRRNVVRVITVYAGAAFVIIELINNITDPLRLPEWTPTFVIVLLAIGFPIVIIFSWIYDVHPERGIEKTKPAEKDKAEDIPKSSKSWKIASYISFVVIAALIVLNIIPRTGNKRTIDKSIAVLPFRNESSDDENTYFINGMMESILDNLSRIEDLRVVSRNSVEKYRDDPKPTPVVAVEMDVGYLLEGSGQKVGNRLFLTLQLIVGNDDRHIWSKQYDREIEKVEDLIDIQKEVAQLVVEEIEAIITPEEKELLEKIPTSNLTAYDFYQRGTEELWNYNIHRDRNAPQRAEVFFRKALEYDATYAKAYSGLANVYLIRNSLEDIFISEEILDSANILIDMALSFDDKLSDAYVIRGNIYGDQGKTELAIIEYDKAIQYSPNNWFAYNQRGLFYANNDNVKNLSDFYKAASLNRGPLLPDLLRNIAVDYMHCGFLEKAASYNLEAFHLDGDSGIYIENLGYIASISGNYDEGIAYYKQALSKDSTNTHRLSTLGHFNMYLKNYEESLKYFKEYFRCLPDSWTGGGQNTMHRFGYAYLKNGIKDTADYYFDQQIQNCKLAIELNRYYASEYFAYYDLAAIYAVRGEREKAYENLRIFNQREFFGLYMVPKIKNDPMFDNIRDEPEFQQIVRDVEAKYNAEHERVRQWLEENDML